MENIHDVVIIGAGPAGLVAGVCVSRAGGAGGASVDR